MSEDDIAAAGKSGTGDGLSAADAGADPVVAVGSRNPVKRAATERAFDRAGFVVAVESVAVDSGVAEQPRGREETVRGARTRAERALDALDDATLGVGLEGGVAEGPPGTTGLWLVMWAGATDGTRTATGGGPSIRLPADVGSALRSGRELGPALDEREARSGVARAEGAAGLFSGGAMDRTSALAHAVAGALGPFVTEAYR